MKRVLASIVLGTALLAPCGSALGEQHRATEPSWGIKPERPAPVSPLDLAHWLARRLSEAVGVLVPAPTTPVPAPVTSPVPNEGDETCPPERWHCPIG